MDSRRGALNVPEISVVIRRNGKILFVLREHTGYADGFYALPGGHVEAGELFTTAAVRETLEEVGVTIQPDELKPLLAMHRAGRTPDDIRMGMFMEAATWYGEAKNMEPERHSEIAWFDEQDLPYDKIMYFQAEGLQAIARGNIYSELAWSAAATGAQNGNNG